MTDRIRGVALAFGIPVTVVAPGVAIDDGGWPAGWDEGLSEVEKQIVVGIWRWKDRSTQYSRKISDNSRLVDALEDIIKQATFQEHDRICSMLVEGLKQLIPDAGGLMLVGER